MLSSTGNSAIRTIFLNSDGTELTVVGCMRMGFKAKLVASLLALFLLVCNDPQSSMTSLEFNAVTSCMLNGIYKYLQFSYLLNRDSSRLLRSQTDK